MGEPNASVMDWSVYSKDRKKKDKGGDTWQRVTEFVL